MPGPPSPGSSRGLNSRCGTTAAASPRDEDFAPWGPPPAPPRIDLRVDDPSPAPPPIDLRVDEPPPAPTSTNGYHHSVYAEPTPAYEPTTVNVAAAPGGTLRAHNVSAWFSGRKVLDRCSLDMPAGEVSALIGPSGCGKSTFLRILNRMHEVIPGAQMGGVVDLDGVDIYGPDLNATEIRLRIGMVFQKPNPFPSMSIRENVLAGLKLARLKVADPDELVQVSLQRAGLWNEVKDRLDQGGAALSGGQQQRLCIARALAVKPRVLLMDEPCSALDPISTRVIEQTIRELAHEVTIVIVTHNMQQAARVSDWCAFFLVEQQGEPGGLVESGRTELMFNNPVDRRTGDYVSGRFG